MKSRSVKSAFSFPPPRLDFCAGWSHEVKERCSFHAHQTFEIVYHLRGGGSTTIQTENSKRTIVFDEGSVVVYPPEMMHDQHNPQLPAVDACVHFTMRKPWPKEILHCLYVPAPVGIYEKEELINLAGIHFSLNSSQRLAVGYRLTALIVNLLQKAAQKAATVDYVPSKRYAEEAWYYLHQYFKQIQSIENVAHSLGISYNYLRHVFKLTFGMSLIQALNEFRIEYAKDLLIHSKLPMKSIATLCGFQNERYLATRFKKQTHITPGSYRRRKR
jgi:AraC-like DNA-binding protein